MEPLYNNSSISSIFSYKRISKHFYIITEHCFRHTVSCIYVIVGAEKVLVVDSGFGLGSSIYHYIRDLLHTDLPFTCVCTHGHPDCTGGIGEFDDVYLNEEDFKAFPNSFTVEGRLKNLRLTAQNDDMLIDYNEEPLFPNDVICAPVQDGDNFDLGEIYADVIGMPGHTPGSIILHVYNLENMDIYLVGDCFSPDVTYLTTLTNRIDLLNYAAMLRRFCADVNADALCYCSHLAQPLYPDIALDVAVNCEEAASGAFPHESSFISVKHTGGKVVPLLQHLCRNLNVVYSADIAS